MPETDDPRHPSFFKPQNKPPPLPPSRKSEPWGNRFDAPDMAGLAIKAAVRDKPAKEENGILQKFLFYFIFFIVTGFLIDPGRVLSEHHYQFPIGVSRPRA
jgi:hypothetical protein